MPECPFCGGETTLVAGCRERRLAYGEPGTVEPVEPYRYGREDRFEEIDPTAECPECDAAAGEYHHVGCRLEQCPECGEQLEFCDCEPVLLTRE